MKIRVRFEPIELKIPDEIACSHSRIREIINSGPAAEEVNDWLVELFPNLDAGWEVVRTSKGE